MPEQEAPYDPYIPSSQQGGQQQQQGGGNARTQALQATKPIHCHLAITRPTSADQMEMTASSHRHRELPLGDAMQIDTSTEPTTTCDARPFCDGSIREALNPAPLSACIPVPSDLMGAPPSLAPFVASSNMSQSTRIPQIDDTVGVMRDNINKVSQRGERLDALQDKTDNLAVSAQGFRRGANRVRKQMWWKDMKMRMCLIVGIIVLLVIIIVPAVVATR
ncbi:hypothetical protein G7Z17_g13061 [Cylindrodendrum hubeiense]|uniref:V-SNARE coiled-coil homology domain-containing protein n=1 Tax=Cylindrodendrum hubeiense TaxID=595255 RepID=A0A9P5GZN7_9HYPO|nr:hypothetical protein G7Z17_g13061 [Cylindrodendrum hubeiense]